jgi:hypothetical protein
VVEEEWKVEANKVDSSYYDRQQQPNLINPIGFAQTLGMPGISSFYKFVDLIVSKSVSGFTLEYPKLMLHLAPLMVAETTNEYQKNSMITALTRYIVTLLSPIVRQFISGDDPEISDLIKKEIKDRYVILKAHASACGNVKIDSSIERSGQYVTYKFKTEHSTYKPQPGIDIDADENNTEQRPDAIRNPNVELEPISAAVECTEPVIDVGWSIARDNGYNRINCHAENTLTEALTLASDLGLISYDDNLSFEERTVTPSDMHSQIERQKQILGRSDEDHRPARKFKAPRSEG